MVVGIDISQIVYQTGVSDYTVNLVRELLKQSEHKFRLFGGSLRKASFIESLFPNSFTYPLSPVILDLLWNRLHWLRIENFLGPLDVFHSSDWTEPPSRCPKVTTVHDLSPFLFPNEMSSGGVRDVVSVHTRKMAWAIKECERIICVSQNTAADLKRLFSVPASRVFIIPEALPSRFDISVTPAQVTAVKVKFGLSKDYLITIGTRQPRKNLKRLIDAFLIGKTKPRFPQKLVIVGAAGWQAENLTHPDILYTGFVTDFDLSALVSGARVFALPSLYEGFGLPILIAFRHLVPVVTSSVSSLAEVAGNAAILVNPLETESIAAGLSKALNQSAKLVKLGTDRLRDFSWTKTAARTLDAYKSVC